MSLFFDPTQPKVKQGQVYIRSLIHPKEFLYIEIQGEINSTLPFAQSNDPTSSSKQYLWGQQLGNFEERSDGYCSLIIGNLKLEGKKEKLKKPLLIVSKRKVDQAPTAQRATAQPTTTAPPKAANSEMSDSFSVAGESGVSSLLGDSDTWSQLSGVGSLPMSLSLDPNSSEYNQLLDKSNSVVISTLEADNSTQLATQLRQLPAPANPGPQLDVPIPQTFNTNPLDQRSILAVDGIINSIVKFSKRPIPLVRASAAASTAQPNPS